MNAKKLWKRLFKLPKKLTPKELARSRARIARQNFTDAIDTDMG
ncbi:MAG: hypothetical protein QNJ38_09935 [Prochloraceae cyanobacterium]|nr:hypothetical protein [Prochloraceae cyanobacterium]